MIHSFWKDKCQGGFFIADSGETKPKSSLSCRYLIAEIIRVHFGSMKMYRQKREKISVIPPLQPQLLLITCYKHYMNVLYYLITTF